MQCVQERVSVIPALTIKTALGTWCAMMSLAPTRAVSKPFETPCRVLTLNLSRHLIVFNLFKTEI